MDKKNIDESSIENLSHYIKTPLSIIQGYCDLLSAGIAGKLNEEQGNYVKKIKKEILKADNFLNNFIDGVEEQFKENLQIKHNCDMIALLKDLFLVVYTYGEKNEIYPDFILPHTQINVEIYEDTEKALILLIHEFMKFMDNGQHLVLKLQLNTESFEMILFPSKNRLIQTLDDFKTNFIFITAEKILKSSGFDIFLNKKDVVIKYEFKK